VRIRIPKNAQCGSVSLPANEYWVSLNSEASEFTLSASGKDIRVKATRRKSQSKSRTTTVQFFSGGGKIWSFGHHHAEARRMGCFYRIR
jgi:hypothetical protein